MSEHRNSPFLSPNTPRLSPPRGHTRTPSRSPTRSRLSVYDDIFADLSPASTYEAFTNPSGRLQAGIEAASQADRAFGLRAALASKNIQEWVDELEEWEWPAEGGSSGFEIPAAKRRKLSQNIHTSSSAGEGRLDPEYMGSLPSSAVFEYEARIDQIHNEMDDLHVEDIKRQVLDTHFSSRSRPSSSASNATTSMLSSYSRMDDFTAIVTATVLKALPNLSRLMRMMDVWSIRLKILRKVPRLLMKLEEAELAIKSGWKAIRLPEQTTTGANEQSIALSREDFRIMLDVLQTQVTRLGQELDYMLDTLEGREDTLPDAWLDRMEAIEQDYGEWVVAGDRKVREGEWAKIARNRKEKEDILRKEVEEAARVEAEKEAQEQELRKQEEEASWALADKERLLVELKMREEVVAGERAQKEAREVEVVKIELERETHELEAAILNAEEESEAARLKAEDAELSRKTASQEAKEAEIPRIVVEKAAAAQLQAEEAKAAQLRAEQDAQTRTMLKLAEQKSLSQHKTEGQENTHTSFESEEHHLGVASALTAVSPDHEEEILKPEEHSRAAHGALLTAGAPIESTIDHNSGELQDHGIKSSTESPSPELDASINGSRSVIVDSLKETADQDDNEPHLPSITPLQETLVHSNALDSRERHASSSEASRSLDDAQPSSQVSKQSVPNPILLTPAALSPPAFIDDEVPKLNQFDANTPKTPTIGLLRQGPLPDLLSIDCDHPDHVSEAHSEKVDTGRHLPVFDGIDDLNIDSFSTHIEQSKDTIPLDQLSSVPRAQETLIEEPSTQTIHVVSSPNTLEIPPRVNANQRGSDSDDPVSHGISVSTFPAFEVLSPAQEMSEDEPISARLETSASVEPPNSEVDPDILPQHNSRSPTGHSVSTTKLLEDVQLDSPLQDEVHSRHRSISSVYSLSDPTPEILEAEPAEYFRPVLTPVKSPRKPDGDSEPTTPRSFTAVFPEMTIPDNKSTPTLAPSSPRTPTKFSKAIADSSDLQYPALSNLSDLNLTSQDELENTLSDLNTAASSIFSNGEQLESQSHATSAIHDLGDGAVESKVREPPIEHIEMRTLARKTSITRINSPPKRISIPRRDSNASSNSTVIRGPTGNFLTSPARPSTPDYAQADDSFREADDLSPSIRRHRNGNSHDYSSPDSPPPIPDLSSRKPITYPRTSSFSSTAPSEASASSPDTPLFGNLDVTSTPPSSPKKSSTDDQLQQQISSLLESIPARIKLTSEPDSNPPGRLVVKRSRASLGPAFRSSSSMSNYSRAPTPSFTLAPAYGKGQSRQRPQSSNPEIKLYHLSRSTGEAPIKLFVRLVGENGERVMVRVGGGWADLGEYLKEYASHHGRRTGAAVDDSKVEIQDMTSRVVSSSSTTSTATIRANGKSSPVSRPGSAFDRPMSSLNMRKTRQSTGSDLGVPIHNHNFRSPSTPLPSTALNRNKQFETPPSAASSSASASSERGYDRSSSRLSWTEEDSNLGLAGPKSKKVAISERDQEWVESMKEKVRQASAEKEKTKQRGTSFGEMEKVGGTKRLFRKS